MANIHFQKQLIHICNIERATITRSSSGAEIFTWAVSAADEPCRYVQRQERIAVEPRSFQMEQVNFILFNNGVDVNVADRIANIRMASDSSVIDAGPFEIEADLERNSTSAHHIRLNLERIE